MRPLDKGHAIAEAAYDLSHTAKAIASAIVQAEAEERQRCEQIWDSMECPIHKGRKCCIDFKKLLRI